MGATLHLLKTFCAKSAPLRTFGRSFWNRRKPDFCAGFVAIWAMWLQLKFTTDPVQFQGRLRTGVKWVFRKQFSPHNTNTNTNNSTDNDTNDTKNKIKNNINRRQI